MNNICDGRYFIRLVFIIPIIDNKFAIIISGITMASNDVRNILVVDDKSSPNVVMHSGVGWYCVLLFIVKSKSFNEIIGHSVDKSSKKSWNVIHFSPIFHFCISRKRLETFGFQRF